MAWVVALILAALGWPWLLVGMAIAALGWLVIIGAVGFAHADPDFQLGLVLLSLIVGCVAGAAWLLIRLFRVEQVQVKPMARKEPHL
jgi:hypothetical protein